MVRMIARMADSRIVQVEVGPLPRPKPAGLFDPMPSVTVTFESGERRELLRTLYPDEWMVEEGDLLGLTDAEARAFLQRKDVEYLQRP